MKTVIIDINCSASTIYYVGVQGDNNVTTLQFTDLESNGNEYAVNLQNSERTFKKIPLVNNEFVLTSGYTGVPGLLNVQVYVKKDNDWIAYSKPIKLMLLNGLQEDTPEPEPGDTTEYVIYKEYESNGYDISGLGPCVVQNEKTDVNIMVGSNEHTEIDCLGGQYTLIKKVDGRDGVIGYYTDDDGRCNYLELSGGTIINGFADGDNHWGLLSVSADNKTLTKLEFVNGLKTDVSPTSDSDVVNKSYVDNLKPSGGNGFKQIDVTDWVDAIVNTYNYGINHQTDYCGLTAEFDLSDYIGKTILFNVLYIYEETRNVRANDLTLNSQYSEANSTNTFMTLPKLYDKDNDGNIKCDKEHQGLYPYHLVENNDHSPSGLMQVTEKNKILACTFDIQNKHNNHDIYWPWLNQNTDVPEPTGIICKLLISEVE